MFVNFTPWQILLWIVALELVTAPLLCMIFSSVFNAYYRAKDAHIGRVLNALGKTIEAATNKITKKEDTNGQQQE